jgi:hypothetical protein
MILAVVVELLMTCDAERRHKFQYIGHTYWLTELIADKQTVISLLDYNSSKSETYSGVISQVIGKPVRTYLQVGQTRMPM